MLKISGKIVMLVVFLLLIFSDLLRPRNNNKYYATYNPQYKRLEFRFYQKPLNIVNLGKGELASKVSTEKFLFEKDTLFKIEVIKPINKPKPTALDNILLLKYFTIAYASGMAQKDGLNYMHIADSATTKANYVQSWFFINKHNREINPSVYVEVSTQFAKLYKLVGSALVILFGIIPGLLMLLICIFILYELFFDRPFTNKILKLLRFNYMFCFLFPILSLGFFWFTGFLQRAHFNDLVEFNFLTFFENFKVFWILAFVFYGLYRAFKKGYYYKQDQDLTV